MVIHRWQKDFFQPTSVNEDLRPLLFEHVRTKCTAWVIKCFILSPAFVPCAMHQHPFQHFTQLLFHQLVLKETLSTRLGNWGANGAAVLGITHTLHYLSNRPLKDPSVCWTERMTRWTSSLCRRYVSRRKHSISDRETGHDERQLKLQQIQFRKWDSVFIISRRSLPANVSNAVTVPNMSAKPLYAARS